MENTDTVEIHKVDIDLGQLYSHHFITFRYRELGESGQPAGNPNNYAQGLRYDNAHNDVTFVTANQESATIDLPDGTGFRWLPQTVLDLNTHYINYDQNKVLKCENFVNIYTQPSGTAVQLMETDLYANTSIIIPATGQDVQFTDDIYGNSTDEVFYWMLTSHTHKLGKDFDVYTRDAQGNPDTQVFDAEYMDGDPNSAFIGYDYQHPPVRYWTYPFLPVQKNLGLQQIATYNNNTGQLVYWGDTSDDEMMITMAMFVEDTAGLGAFTNTTNLQDVASGETLQLYPNPTNGSFVVAINTMDTEEVTLSIFNAIGQQMVAKTINGQSTTEFNLAPYGAGIYSIVVQSPTKVVNRKVVVR